MDELREEITRQILQGAKNAGCYLPQTEMIVRQSLVIQQPTPKADKPCPKMAE